MRVRAHRRHDTRLRFAVVGIAAIVVVIAFGYVSYNALTGLPFQSHYDVNVALRNAERLIATDDVRIAGVRVGQVVGVTATPARGAAAPYAIARLALSPSVPHLPVDSTAEIRSASALGATYVQLVLGHSHATVPPGATLPISQSSATVSVTDLFQVFNGNAARNFQAGIGDLGDAVAGRGGAANVTIGALDALFPVLGSVSFALAAHQTQLSRFISTFASTANDLSPESSQLASLVAGGASTFGAFARERRSLGATIDAAPSTETASTVAFRAVDPGLQGLATLIGRLLPAGRVLPAALRTVNAVASAATPALRRLPSLMPSLKGALVALGQVSGRPSTRDALDGLGHEMSALEQILQGVVPAQTYCNVYSLFFQNISSSFGPLGIAGGPGIGLASVPGLGVAGEQQQSAKPARNLHIDLTPTENGTACDAGNELGFNQSAQSLGVPRVQQPNHTRATYPPPGVLQLAKSAGLYAPPVPAR